eukprot:COSAG05_NODE_1070_length_5967_cov_444.629857_6_plen_78_part_00
MTRPSGRRVHDPLASLLYDPPRDTINIGTVGDMRAEGKRYVTIWAPLDYWGCCATRMWRFPHSTSKYLAIKSHIAPT